MQCGSAVEKYRMLSNDLFENVPDDGFLLLHHLLGLLDRSAMPRGFQLVIDERLEELESHFLRQTALIEPEFWPDDDNRASGIVHALAEQVLTEPPLLAL